MLLKHAHFHYSMHILADNLTTNLAECWMHIQTKFDGGKQISHSQRGAWQGCFTEAGLQWNLGPSWGPLCWEKAVSSTANSIYRQTVEAHAERVTKIEKEG